MNELRRLLGRQVLVQLPEDTTIAGTVALAGKQSITLEAASAVAGDTERPIDGEVVVLVDQILWMQVL
jgi:small nuclear ribonucleoprotein (snRNP)-like protein